MPIGTQAAKKQLHVCLDMALFDPVLLQDEIALESAFGVLEGHLENAAVNQEALFKDLMAVPNLFEYIISGVGERVASVVKACIDNIFPTKAVTFKSSLASALLNQFSQYFRIQKIPSTILPEHRRSVALTGPVLDALSVMTFPADTRNSVTGDIEDNFNGFFGAKQTNQRDRKKKRRAAALTESVDQKPFEKLGVKLPRSAENAARLENQLLGDQKDILMHYLDVLRKPELAPIFRAAYVEDSIPSVAKVVDRDAVHTNAESTNNVQLAAKIPTAYPIIQPMKAAFHFDSVEGFGDWRILVSTRADKNLREAKRGDQKQFAIYLKKIKELSNGHFSDDNHKRLTGSDSDIPIYEAKMTRDTRLVYQVDCITEMGTDADSERQVIRLFGIYTHAQLERNQGLWNAVSRHISGRGKVYRERCIVRERVNAHDKSVSPATFHPNSEMVVPSSPTDLPNLLAEEQQELHSLLALEKFVTFSQALLHSILANQDVAHVFHMSPAEQDVVKHAGSCYVLGRSGTGKTTTMLFKMLGMEQAYDNLRAELNDEVPRPRQLFVTQSRVLAEKVREYYIKLAKSHAPAQRNAAGSTELTAKQTHGESQGLIDRDEEELHDGTLPKSFNELKDEHFPLFITFDHLCRLLEANFKELDSELDVTLDDTKRIEDAKVASDYMLQHRNSFVSYTTFLNEYWPHFPQGLSKALDPALVFAEFMGVIKGSEDCIRSEKGYLEREQYLQLSHRQQSMFSKQRDTVYRLFQVYLSRKRERRDWDAADRTHTILRGLREVGLRGRKMDFVYVDEAQDNLLIDALILRYMCSNPDGLLWAGDTAQTISVGSSFRFNDLKAFLYRLENSSGTTLPIKQPQEFQLTVNYRSHGGIVDVAHSVVQLIMNFWPHAIDVLAQERGIVNGLKPIFFSGWDQDTVRYKQFLFGATGSQVEFGAQQCILVRDDVARCRLREQVGDIGLVLTLYESKGLEFNDVLLYNFFEDSTVDAAQWRVVLNALPAEQDIKRPRFDEVRHNGVCRELKFLYVAITRARRNLWVADCSNKGEPLRLLWNAWNLVENVSAINNVPHLAASSTAEEWAHAAKTLFDNRRYLQASQSYEKAEKPRERDVALAYHYREQARNLSRATENVPRKLAFVQAADMFLISAGEVFYRSPRRPSEGTEADACSGY